MSVFKDFQKTSQIKSKLLRNFQNFNNTFLLRFKKKSGGVPNAIVIDDEKLEDFLRN